MASYGKKDYWNERYAREDGACDWIVTGYSFFRLLFTPAFLSHSHAPPPGGVIQVRRLADFQERPCANEDVEEESRQLSSPANGAVRFPPKHMARVLHVGCGNSQLGELMLHGGFTDVVNVDYSEVVIRKMNERYNKDFYADLHSCIEREELLRHSLGLPGLESRDDSNQKSANGVRKPTMRFEVGDICEGLQYPDESFDLIVAKKTLDMVLCSAGSLANARAMISECFRLLSKDHGVLIILSSAKPEDRAVFFENDAWTGVENIKLPSKEDYGQFDHQRKGHEKKRVDSYVYILYKQIGTQVVDL